MKTKTSAVQSVVHSEEAASNAANPPTRAAGALRCPDIYLPHQFVTECLDAIAVKVAEQFQLTTGKLQTRTRNPHIAWPRQIAMYIAYQRGYRHTVIARYWKYDHGTVIHAYRTVLDRMDVYPDLKILVDRIVQSIATPAPGTKH